VRRALELADIQGLVVRGYGKLHAAAYLVMEISDAALARSWLAAVAGAVTTAARRPGGSALNVALTARGLSRLGVDDELLAGFSVELRQGMTEPSRARALGDVGDSEPSRWVWGAPGGRSVDVLLLLYAADEAALREVLAEHGSPPGLDLVARLDTVDLGGREPFGFHDGISQPAVEGLSRKGPAGQGVRAGEFVLGYPNEFGETARVPELGRNGTYLVVRQLAQDVEGFWRFCAAATGDAPGGPASVGLAARLVGRWPGGAPLVLSPDRDDPTLAGANDFGYFGPDPHGERCPIGSHVRRANPRDALEPDAGSPRSLAVVRQHRILRRGRPYGRPGSERGLHFLCLNANLSRQFEFLQRSWLCNEQFNGLYEDADPLIGVHRPPGGIFTVQGSPLRRRYSDLPRFVTVRGGAYFLLPGMSALRRLAQLGTAAAG
jgi:Dyp-type peroxidase family